MEKIQKLQRIVNWWASRLTFSAILFLVMAGTMNLWAMYKVKYLKQDFTLIDTPDLPHMTCYVNYEEDLGRENVKLASRK